MQHRTSSPCTQSGASVEFRVVILVLSKHFFVFSARVSLKQRAIKTRTPTRHRRIITPRSGLGTCSARLVFWKAEIQARTSVPLPGTCGSRRARPVRTFHRAFLSSNLETAVPLHNTEYNFSLFLPIFLDVTCKQKLINLMSFWQLVTVSSEKKPSQWR